MQFMTIGSFVFFTALVGLITWLLTRKDKHDTSDGYFLGGRTLSAGFIAGSLLLTNLSTEQLIGLNGDAFTDGLSVMAWEVIAAFSLVVMALYFLPKYLKSGITTIPQFLELRFNGQTRAITSIIFIVAYATILLPIVLYTGATGLNTMLDVGALFGFQSETATLWFTVWLIGIIGSIYAIFGGLRTVAVSDTINGFGLLVGGLLITWFAFQEISPDAPLAAVSILMDQHPEKFNSLGAPDQKVPFSTLFTGVLLLNLFYWCTNQQIIQRTFGASSLKEGQKGVLMAGAFKILAPVILVLPGIAAYHLYSSVSINDEQVAVLDAISEQVAVLGHWDNGDEIVQTFLYGNEAIDLMGLDASQDYQALAAEAESHENQAFEYNGGKFHVVKGLAHGDVVTQTVDGAMIFHTDFSDEQLKKMVPIRNQDKAYGRLVRNVLPPYLTGFFAAAIIGAILSSFNSGLNSTATLFSLGVYKDMLHPTAEEKQIIRSGKIFGIIVALFAMTVAPLLAGQDSIFGYLQKMNGLYFIPIFAVVLMGIFNKRTPPAAANIGLVLGFAAISAGYFLPAAMQYVAFLHGFHFLGMVFVSLILLMTFITILTPLKEPRLMPTTDAIDLTPWKFAKPAGLLLVLIVLGIYLYFADTSVIPTEWVKETYGL